jgi:hypothetical protein
VDKALAIVRKNLLSIICGFVALLAMIALYYPLSGMRDRFRAELTARALAFNQAKQLLASKRVLPIVDVTETEPTPLSTFPNAKIIEAATQARDTVQHQSDQMMEKAIELNQAGHALLLAPDVLPNPGDRVFNYRTAYLKQVQEGLPAMLGAVMPPNQDTIKKKLDELHKTEVDDRVFQIGGVDANRTSLEADFQEMAAKLPDQLREQSATQNKLYMDPNSALTINHIMTDPIARPTPRDIWYAQLALWIQQDVAASIIAANSIIPNSNILNDAVKRIVAISIPEGATAYLQNSAAVGGPGAGPAPGDDSSADVRDFTKSPTGHVCNDLCDAVTFSLVLEADQRQIPTILHELQKDKLMTVLTVDISSIDAAEADAQGFIYGTAPMVKLSLNCETLFLRKWTLPLMPDEVRNELHIASPTPDAAGGAPLQNSPPN